MSEIQFQKYKTRGTGYHWEQIGNSPKKRNIYVVARYELILDLIGNEVRDKKILDVGCGDGVLSYLLSKKGAKVTGVDSSEEAIKFAKEKCKDLGKIDFLVASACELPFEDKSFDYVVSSEVIEHIKEPQKMLKEIRRVWNEKSKVIITTPIRYTKKPLDKMHYQEYFEEDFKELLEKYFSEYKIEVVRSHPLFWMELQNKITFGHSLIKIFLNSLNVLFGFNPFKRTKGWKFYTLQIAVISK